METLREFKITTKKYKSKFVRKQICSSDAAYEVIKQFYHEDINLYESCFVLFLDNSNMTIGYAKISQGGVASTVVDIKIIAKYAIDSLASSVILAHNHPSGTLKPSSDDINVTKKIDNTLKLFNCKLLDSIILTQNGFHSLTEDGIL